MKVRHVLAGLPFAGVLVGMFFVDSVEPYVRSLRFAMFWVVVNFAVTALVNAATRGGDAAEGPHFSRTPEPARARARQA